MRHTTTHTYVLLAVSRPLFDEVRKKFEEAGYGDQIHVDDKDENTVIIDMHGIALIPRDEEDER